MEIGIPVEPHQGEYRVGLTPQGVTFLAQAGHRCYVERGAGQGAGFQDTAYEKAGARIVYDVQEVYGRADLILKVGTPTANELALLRQNQTVCAFWHLAACPREVTQTLVETRVTAVAYETIQRDDGCLPVLHPLSEIAGRMAPQIAARLLQNDGGGSGILISGIAGIPPIDVCILGGGTVGINAALTFLGLGARVLVLDQRLDRLQLIEERFEGRIATMIAYESNIARVVAFANVLVGAVLVPGARAPVLVTREMVRSMRPRSVILDFSIDQGGCVETSRPMTHKDPVFVEENVIHYCVPNVPGVVARTATQAYLNAALPYIQKIADLGVEAAAEADPTLKRGIAVHNGQVMNKNLAALLERS